MAEITSIPSASMESDYTREELYSYTLRADAICSCFVRDVHQMHDDGGSKDFQVWWLGSIPCRAVKIVGLLIGVTEYEKRTIYTVDDGTAVIDCIHLRQVVRPNVKGKQPVMKASSKGKEPARFETEAYYLPSPSYNIGTTLRISGKIRVYREDEDKQILIDDIDPCHTKEEPRHWIEVKKLHDTKYSQPFTIPAMPAVPSTPASRRTDTQTMPTPQTHSTVPPSSSPPQTSSPQKSSSDHTAKLKHPTRLHSKDLTANTFRIYVKHYMDSLCRKQLSRAVSRNSSQEDVFLDDTSPNRTPRASKRSESGKKPILQGISLSHLRRVDDLRVLARRVVAAEGKRRERDVKQKEKEARRKEREGASQRGTAVRLSPKQASKLTPTTLKPVASTEPTSAKVKRLFLWTVRKLLEDGGIIVCEGPGLPLPRSTDMNERSLSCWKDVTNTTINSVSLDTSTLSKSSLISIQSSVGKDPEDDWPSDPDSDYQEECYLPLSNEVLAQPLLDAIAIIVRPGSGLRGATISEMMTRLKRDDRWKQVGEWHIQDALEYLDEVDKVWKVSGDRWGLVRC